MFASFILFIIVGHMKSKPSTWGWIPLQVVVYYAYSLLWPFMYTYSIIHYAIKRGNIQWAKTVHVGAGQDVQAQH